jgi:hypothetical protein
MSAPLSLETIVRQECLPAADCMLTVTDDNGEAGFLYFKDGELIEANFSSLWGKDALGEILKWHIFGRALAPLPLGIKRSLWDPLETLLYPGRSASADGSLPTSPVFKTTRTVSTGIRGGLDRYRNIPNLLRMVEVGRDHETVLFEAPADRGEQEETAWLVEFAGRVRAVGETLGFGTCGKWTIDTEKSQIVGFRHDDKFVAVLRRKDAMQEDLESAVTATDEAD